LAGLDGSPGISLEWLSWHWLWGPFAFLGELLMANNWNDHGPSLTCGVCGEKHRERFMKAHWKKAHPEKWEQHFSNRNRGLSNIIGGKSGIVSNWETD
jgi:hypothetical protein